MLEPNNADNNAMGRASLGIIAVRSARGPGLQESSGEFLVELLSNEIDARLRIRAIHDRGAEGNLRGLGD
ncbi:MAG: hypothetical protein AAGD14_12115 [Planctomycetota bacterium]